MHAEVVMIKKAYHTLFRESYCGKTIFEESE